MFYAVIMAGGQGTRLWPMSRKNKPKQLQSLASEKTLIQETVERISPLFKPGQIIVSTTPEYARHIRQLLPDIPKKNYLLEPSANGTAAACALITSILRRRDSDATIAIIYSDHSVEDGKAFCRALARGEKLVRSHPDHIVTVGIKPTRPDTGLGYIQRGKSAGVGVYQVKRFVEKPDLRHAKRYLQSGDYLWNTGMFVWQAAHFEKMVGEYMPKTHKIINQIAAKDGQPEYETFLNQNYGRAENTSIDYGIMERTRDILVIRAGFAWSDIGNWGTLFELLSRIHKTTVVSRGQHVSHGDENCLVLGKDKLIATVGLKDVAVIDTDDAILICNRHKAHQVKDLLAKFKDQGREIYL